MRLQFIIETKGPTLPAMRLKTNGVNTGVNGYGRSRCLGAVLNEGHVDGGQQWVVTQNVLDIGNEQFLVLLFVIETNVNQSNEVGG